MLMLVKMVFGYHALSTIQQNFGQVSCSVGLIYDDMHFTTCNGRQASLSVSYYLLPAVVCSNGVCTNQFASPAPQAVPMVSDCIVCLSD